MARHIESARAFHHVNRILFGVCLTLLSLLAAGIGARRYAGLPANPAALRSVPVVVELFTSEGCSSCPPADKLLAELDAKPYVAGVEVIALEEHVDYWNSLGWVDPFSSHQMTERQAGYAGALGNQNVYTPQMVVDGRTEFVGSRKLAAQRAIAEAARAEKIAVEISRQAGASPDVREIHIRIGPLAAAVQRNAQIWLAVTESGLHSNVTRGENAGEMLYHGPVTRSLTLAGQVTETGDASLQATAAVHRDSQWNAGHLSIVVFVQDRRSRRILGAARIPFGE